jgi:hypothetical protein
MIHLFAEPLVRRLSVIQQCPSALVDRVEVSSCLSSGLLVTLALGVFQPVQRRAEAELGASIRLVTVAWLVAAVLLVRTHM